MAWSRFDQLNAETSDYNNRVVPSQSWYWSQGTGLSARERIAERNNETFRANNGSYPDRPYGPYGTYSTGRRY